MAALPANIDNTPAPATLAEHAEAIRGLAKRAIGDLIEIGRRLAECRAIKKDDGAWRAWLDQELRLSPQTAGRFIQVYQLALDHSNLEHVSLPASGLYTLAAPSTPEEARTEVIERAEQGERLSVKDVQAIVDKTRRKDKPTSKPQPTTKPKVVTPVITAPPTAPAQPGCPGPSSGPAQPEQPKPATVATESYQAGAILRQMLDGISVLQTRCDAWPCNKMASVRERISDRSNIWSSKAAAKRCRKAMDDICLALRFLQDEYRAQEKLSVLHDLEIAADQRKHDAPPTAPEQPETSGAALAWSGMVPCGSSPDDDHVNLAALCGDCKYIAMVQRKDDGTFSHYSVSFYKGKRKRTIGADFKYLGSAKSLDVAKEIARQHADKAKATPISDAQVRKVEKQLNDMLKGTGLFR